MLALLTSLSADTADVDDNCHGEERLRAILGVEVHDVIPGDETR